MAYFKMKQSRIFGFDSKVEFKTLPHIIIGIILWPYLIFLVFSERKIHKDAYRKAMTEKTDFDRELDEIESLLEDTENDNKK